MQTNVLEHDALLQCMMLEHDALLKASMHDALLHTSRNVALDVG